MGHGPGAPYLQAVLFPPLLAAPTEPSAPAAAGIPFEKYVPLRQVPKWTER